MRTWDAICERYALHECMEQEHHPHDMREQSWLYACKDGGTTEYEFLNLLHAMVIATKPATVLECGTFRGFGTLAIAHALAWNGHGKLVTLDIDRCQVARDMIGIEDFSHIVQFEQSEALHVCKDRSRKWDFAFIDSGDDRDAEALALMSGSMNPNGTIAMHDASPYRNGPSSNHKIVEFLSGVPNGIRIWKSRGFQFFQV